MGGMARGTLRIYLGAAPGVGKTFAVLGQAHRRAARGNDVVIGLVETHGRPRTAEQLRGPEVLPRATITHRGMTLTELDVDAVLRRRPEVVVVDELAHTNAPGSRNTKRWQDVEKILAAGICVLTTVNVHARRRAGGRVRRAWWARRWEGSLTGSPARPRRGRRRRSGQRDR